MSTVSGLVSAGSETSMLHHPHQVSDLNSPGDRFVQIVDFDSPAYNRNNRVDVPILDMVVDDAWIEFDIGAVATTSTPSMAPVQTWINSNGIQLLYKNQQVYTMSEAEAVTWMRANASNATKLHKMLDATNDLAVATRRTRNSGGNIYYLWLGPLIQKILSHAGPLTAYPSKAWSLVVGLLPFNQIAEGGNSTAATGGTINSMRLVCSGHRESAANAQRVADALAGEGVRISFNQANHQRTTHASGVASHQINLTALEGEATDVIILQRATAGLDATAPDDVNHLNWSLYDAFADTIEMGTQANPTRVFGLALPQRTIRLIEQGDAYAGGPIFVDSEGNGRNESVLYIALCEGATLAQKFGTFSGALRIKNNFQAILRFSTSAVADTVDVIVYVMRDMLLKHEGMIMINREA